MATKIALAGNPNSGKTTMFNDLTGSNQYVGNWPGVTVEKKEGRLRKNKDVVIQDLPGIYSLSPYTMEEVVSRNYLIGEKPDAIINIVDATNIERNLYLTTQLLELNVPLVIALNMSDILQKKGDIIDKEKLGRELGCIVVETSAVRSEGTKEAVSAAMNVARGKQKDRPHMHFSSSVENALDEIAVIAGAYIKPENMRWYAIKLFERDSEVQKELQLNAALLERIDAAISRVEDALDDDSESIITGQRYDYISSVIHKCVRIKDKNALSTSDKIDRIVTNRILALPIFAVVMFVVYFLSISTIGTWMTDWVNDVLVGGTMEGLAEWMEGANVAPWLNGLVVEGIIGGVGAVIGFLPQMIVLFLCLSLLEDCGYMARIAFIMDRAFRKFGLSGKSFIPILIGTGCGVPGIMASRTIENESDRRMTVITTTFIPCGAKLPIIALIAGALFPDSVWVAPSAYFIGIAAIIVSGIMLKKTRAFSEKPSPFVMELPAYHLPRLKGTIRTTWDRSFSFVKRAGTIVLLAAIGVWFLSSFDWRFAMVETDASILASIGRVIAPVFAPLGWADWRAAVATFTGLIAKENVVGTFGVLYGFAEVAEDGVEYWPQLVSSFSQAAAYSFLVFNLLCAPCFAAIGAVRREMANPRWTWFAIGYQTLFAYVISLIVYQIWHLALGNGFGVGTFFAFAAIVALVYLLVRKPWTPVSKAANRSALKTTV